MTELPFKTCKKCGGFFHSSDEEKLCETCQKLKFEGELKQLGGTKKHSKTKAELVSEIKYWNNIRDNKWDYTKEQRLHAEDKSFEAYEKLLHLVDGDSRLVATLLGEGNWFKKNKVKNPEDSEFL